MPGVLPINSSSRTYAPHPARSYTAQCSKANAPWDHVGSPLHTATAGQPNQLLGRQSYSEGAFHHHYHAAPHGSALQTRKHCVRQTQPFCLASAEPLAFPNTTSPSKPAWGLLPSWCQFASRAALPFWREGKAQTHLQHNSHALSTSSPPLIHLPTCFGSLCSLFYDFPYTNPLSPQLQNLHLHLSPAFHLLLWSWQPS